MLLTVKKEKYMFAATLTGTFVNMVLNYIFSHKNEMYGSSNSNVDYGNYCVYHTGSKGGPLLLLSIRGIYKVTK